VKDRLAQADCKAGYLLDGFPRTVAQAEALASFEKLDAVVNFDLADTEIVKRLSGRRVCKACGTGFHLTAMPPKKAGVCDKCGGELIQRKDDEPASIEERLRVYTANTQPLIDWYAQKGLLKNIDAAPAPEEILKALKKVLH
jgi:adenylate kinase